MGTQPPSHAPVIHQHGFFIFFLPIPRLQVRCPAQSTSVELSDVKTEAQAAADQAVADAAHAAPASQSDPVACGQPAPPSSSPAPPPPTPVAAGAGVASGGATRLAVTSPSDSATAPIISRVPAAQGASAFERAAAALVFALPFAEGAVRADITLARRRRERPRLLLTTSS